MWAIEGLGGHARVAKPYRYESVGFTVSFYAIGSRSPYTGFVEQGAELPISQAGT